MCSNRTIPEYLHRKGRPAVGAFEADELLYRRYPKEPLVLPGSTKISSEAIRLREDSYNRQQFCRDFTDVLYDEVEENDSHFFADWGVIAFLYTDLEHVYTPSDSKDLRRFRASIIHSPNECMYPHCHQVVMVGDDKVDPPKSIKLLMREYMRDIYRVLKRAQQQ